MSGGFTSGGGLGVGPGIGEEPPLIFGCLFIILVIVVVALLVL